MQHFIFTDDKGNFDLLDETEMLEPDLTYSDMKLVHEFCVMEEDYRDRYMSGFIAGYEAART